MKFGACLTGRQGVRLLVYTLNFLLLLKDREDLS